jgi:hypothetical protein
MKVNVTTVLLDGQRARRSLRTLGHRTRLTEVGRKALINFETDRLRQFFPGRIFRTVLLGWPHFNFIEIKSDLTAETQRQGDLQC